MVVTLRAGEETASWQSGQDGCAAANVARSTGDVGGGEVAVTDATCTSLAAKKGTKDPKGAFTSVLHLADIPVPPVGVGAAPLVEL
jgi:hypothetical protein